MTKLKFREWELAHGYTAMRSLNNPAPQGCYEELMSQHLNINGLHKL